jgi:hypothetical protein
LSRTGKPGPLRCGTFGQKQGAAMNQHYADRRKIDPGRGAVLADGTPNDNDRVEIGPTQLAFAEWAAAGLTRPIWPRCGTFAGRG